jgi:threonine/homoserine/homoserine lactone efflux protein
LACSAASLPSTNYTAQFTILVVAYASLVVVIHSLYAVFSSQAKKWLTSERGGHVISRTSGVTLILFGAMLATAKK